VKPTAAKATNPDWDEVGSMGFLRGGCERNEWLDTK
jgi:hypothetical protein